MEIYAFAPGIEPSAIDVQLEKGTLTIAGERKAPAVPEKANVHINERFAGNFRRVITLPDDVDPDSIDAKFRDGMLHIAIQRKQEAQPRRIAIK